MQPRNALLAALLVVCLLVSVSQADYVVRNPSAAVGVWNDNVTNWSNLTWTTTVSPTARIPQAGDDVFVGDIDITAGGAALEVNSLYVGWRSSYAGVPRFNNNTGLNDTGVVNIYGSGDTDTRLTVVGLLGVHNSGGSTSGAGTVNQFSGRVTAGSLRLSDFTSAAGAKGVYNLNGGVFDVGGALYWGDSYTDIANATSGVGEFYQYAGSTVTVASMFKSRGSADVNLTGTVGLIKNSYTMVDGGTLHVTGTMSFARAFRFTATGGAISVGGDVLLASGASSGEGQNTLLELDDSMLEITGQLKLSNRPTGTSRTTLTNGAQIYCGDLTGLTGTSTNVSGIQKTELRLGTDAGIWVRQSNFTVTEAQAAITNGWITGVTTSDINTYQRNGEDYTVIGVPEPATLAVLVAGGAYVLARRRRR